MLKDNAIGGWRHDSENIITMRYNDAIASRALLHDDNPTGRSIIEGVV